MSDIENEVRSIIAEHLGMNMEDVPCDASIIDDLRADSLDQVALVLALEDRFGVDIPDEDAPEIKTVQHAIDYLSEALAMKVRIASARSVPSRYEQPGGNRS